MGVLHLQHGSHTTCSGMPLSSVFSTVCADGDLLFIVPTSGVTPALWNEGLVQRAGVQCAFPVGAGVWGRGGVQGTTCPGQQGELLGSSLCSLIKPLIWLTRADYWPQRSVKSSTCCTPLHRQKMNSLSHNSTPHTTLTRRGWLRHAGLPLELCTASPLQSSLCPASY